MNGCNRWFNMRGNLSCAVVTFLVAGAVVLRGHDLGSALSGLVLIYSVSFSWARVRAGLLGWVVVLVR